MTLISRLIFPTKEKILKAPDLKICEISIIIPVKNNQKGIDNYIDMFVKTHSDKTLPLEIIIVDNNSTSRIQIDKKFSNSQIPIHIIQCHKPGPAAARNAGVDIAKGEWILFNDSDCIPTESILEGYLEANNKSIAYAGNIKALNNNKLSKYYEAPEILIPLKTSNSQGDFIPQYLITANCLVWKKALLEINGFNENITIAGGEDIDLGLRLSEIGNLSYAFNSIAIHDFSDGITGFYKRFKRYGIGNRIIQELWQTNLKPEPFPPNKRTISNYFYAKIQYYSLLKGFKLEDKRILQHKQID